MRRRAFMQSTFGAAMAAQSSASGPQSSAAQTSSGRGLKFGYDSFNFRGYGWKAIQFLDYAAQQKLDAVNLSELGDYESEDPGYLQKVKDHAQQLGIQIDGGLGCMCPTSTSYNKASGDAEQFWRRGLRANKRAGSAIMRGFLGGPTERTGPIEKHMDVMLKLLKAVRSEAMDLGMKIAIESHSDMQAWELKQLVETAGTEFVAVTLDTGNPILIHEDPLLTLETLAPYALLAHCRDSCIFEHPRGAAYQWVAMGDGHFDFNQYFDKFKQLCPNASVHLEILTGTPPSVLPYLEPDYWKVYPKARASDFARFVALAKHGHPYMGTGLITVRGQAVPPSYAAARKDQQQVDLERSFDYCKKVLKLGIRAQA